MWYRLINFQADPFVPIFSLLCYWFNNIHVREPGYVLIGDIFEGLFWYRLRILKTIFTITSRCLISSICNINLLNQWKLIHSRMYFWFILFIKPFSSIRAKQIIISDLVDIFISNELKILYKFYILCVILKSS